MSSTSKKHREFVKEPIGKKPVSALPGVGEVASRKFESAGYDKANDILAQYLIMKKDETQFKQWAKTTSGANSRNVDKIYEGIKDWADGNL